MNRCPQHTFQIYQTPEIRGSMPRILSGRVTLMGTSVEDERVRRIGILDIRKDGFLVCRLPATEFYSVEPQYRRWRMKARPMKEMADS